MTCPARVWTLDTYVIDDPPWPKPQNSQQKSVPDLHVVTVAFLALKKMFFLKKNIHPNFFFFTFFQCNFSVQTLQCFQFFFFCPWKTEKTTQKVAQNRPRPLFPTVQPRPQPTVQNWFSILRNFGTRHLFSYLWPKPVRFCNLLGTAYAPVSEIPNFPDMYICFLSRKFKKFLEKFWCRQFSQTAISK